MQMIETAGLCLPDDGSRRQPWQVRRRRDGAVVIAVCSSRGSWARQEAETIAVEAIAVSLAFGTGNPRDDMARAMERACEEMRDQLLDPDWLGPGCDAAACVVEPDRITVAIAGRCGAVIRRLDHVRERTTPHAPTSDGAVLGAAEHGLRVRADGTIDALNPHLQQWDGLAAGERLLVGTRLVAARFAEQGAETLRALIVDASDELRRDPGRVGDDGLVAVLARL